MPEPYLSRCPICGCGDMHYFESGSVERGFVCVSCRCTVRIGSVEPDTHLTSGDVNDMRSTAAAIRRRLDKLYADLEVEKRRGYGSRRGVIEDAIRTNEADLYDLECEILAHELRS